MPAPILSSPVRPLKRPRGEIADSDDDDLDSEDDYGWGDDDAIAAEDLIHDASQFVQGENETTIMGEQARDTSMVP